MDRIWGQADILARARAWRDHDPDVATRDAVTGLLERVDAGDMDAATELRAAFAGPLAFGTAGLRGALGAGESRMNVAVVTRATAGVAAYLTEVIGAADTGKSADTGSSADAAGPTGGTAPRVVVGCDARHGSADLADTTCGVLAAAGITVLRLPDRLPTPVTAFATRTLDCDAGIMITASHNPASDNGYKLYLGGRMADAEGRGVQLVAPADADIAARIAAAPPADEVPTTRTGIVSLAGDARDADGSVVADYIARVATYRRSAGPARIRVVLTAMHGVGGATAMAVLRAAGVTDVHVVAEQFDPDPGFPTVAFPNPEEAGALDLAFELARDVRADLVIALDPDADRCAVGIPDGGSGWRRLTGDEVGALLGEQAATDPRRTGTTLACSLVSGRLLARIAAAHGLPHRVTLTGFKWIARTPDLRFGYEEAIGYCTDPEAVRDKDGIGAMMRVIALAEESLAAGRTLGDDLDDLARRHGLHTTAQLSVRVADAADRDAVLARLRTAAPTRLGDAEVIESIDLAAGHAGLPPTPGVLVTTAADDRVIIRPSGTEPKIKCYLEVVSRCGEGGEVPHAAAAERLRRLEGDVGAWLGC